MAVLTLPDQSRTAVVVCVSLQGLALYCLLQHSFGANWLVVPAALIISGFLADWISGLFHFSFDYVWPATTPIMGPIAVDFRRHHEDPTLDPSAKLTNLSKGAYGALFLAGFSIALSRATGDTLPALLADTTLFLLSVWMLFFHQIHSYAHMGSTLPAEEFNRAVVRISALECPDQQRQEFAALFDSLRVPRTIRFLQRHGVLLRPEIHWRHHQVFETDFSSVNGWSDPLMNWVYRPLAVRRKSQRLRIPIEDLNV